MTLIKTSNKNIKTITIMNNVDDNANLDVHECEYNGMGRCKIPGCFKREIRYFKCRLNGEEIGRFCGNTPKQAASKVFSMLLRKHKDAVVANDVVAINEGVVFEIRECSRWKKDKRSFFYSGSRRVFDVPTEICIKHKGDFKYIRFNGVNVINRIKKHQIPEEFLDGNGF
jgi:hypothetical protein